MSSYDVSGTVTWRMCTDADGETLLEKANGIVPSCILRTSVCKQYAVFQDHDGRHGRPCLIRQVGRADVGADDLHVGSLSRLPGRRHPCRVRAVCPLMLCSGLQWWARTGGQLPLSICVSMPGLSG